MMQSEESIEIDHRLIVRAAWRGNGNRRAHAIVIGLGERHHDVQTVGGAALKQHHQLFLAGRGRGRDGAAQKSRQRAHADHGDAAIFQKYSPRNFHGRVPLSCIDAVSGHRVRQRR